jgi:hypothetical protein
MNGYVMQTKPEWTFFRVVGAISLIFAGPWGWIAMFVSYRMQSQKGDFSTFEGIMSLVGFIMTCAIILIVICLLGTALGGGYETPGVRH